jgi:hypothetical protein
VWVVRFWRGKGVCRGRSHPVGCYWWVMQNLGEEIDFGFVSKFVGGRDDFGCVYFLNLSKPVLRQVEGVNV